MTITTMPTRTFLLLQYMDLWREIWTDGRALPTNVGGRGPTSHDPKYNGYSIGRWEDDYTFVVNSNGTDERTWLDNAGNPHSNELRVEERWHRTSEKRLELTVTLDDPKAYTKQWVALDKLQFVQIPSNTDLIEMMNAASEAQAVAASYRAK